MTGHADHQQATRAALAAADDLNVGVLACAVREPVATALNTELGTDFRGRCAVEIDLTIVVDRYRQHRAIACHRSQSADNPVLRAASSSPARPNPSAGYVSQREIADGR